MTRPPRRSRRSRTSSPSRTDRPRVLLISGEPFGAEMRGPAIRAYQLGRVLSEVADVTLAGPGDSEAPAEPQLAHVDYKPHDPRGLREPIAQSDTIVAQPQWPLVTAWMQRSRARLIYDLFVPEALEALQRYPGGGSWRARLLSSFMADRLSDALRTGHHFMCAAERQRDLYIGAMLAEALLTPELSERDPSLRSVIDLVPYGAPPEPPVATGKGGASARFEGIDAGDEVVLWTSAVWPWFDADTAIRAMALLRERRPRARLVFMGQAAGPSAEAARVAQALAGELGLLDRSVFFNDRWVPYAERVDWLLEAACALSTHHEHLETHFAFRSRYLDCFWAGLPVVCTRGDELADVIERDDLGATVPEADSAALADALERVLKRGRAAYGPALKAAAERYAWPVVAEPLVRWITSPGLPPRLGDGAPRRSAGHAARSASYRTARAALATVGATRLSGLLSAPEG